MNKIVAIILILVLFGCQSLNRSEFTKELTDAEWEDILVFTVDLSIPRTLNIFKDFDNKRVKGFLKYAYQYCDSILGYEIDNSIINYINQRKNHSIQNGFDTMFNSKLSFTSDTAGVIKEYLIYSEPFLLHEKLLCLSTITVSPSKDQSDQIVWFFEYVNDTYELILFYRKSNDQIFERGKL